MNTDERQNPGECAKVSVAKFFKEQEKEKGKNPAPLDLSEVPSLMRTVSVFTDIIGLAYRGVLGNYLVERVCLSRIWEWEGDGWGGLRVFGGKIRQLGIEISLSSSKMHTWHCLPWEQLI